MSNTNLKASTSIPRNRQNKSSFVKTTLCSEEGLRLNIHILKFCAMASVQEFFNNVQHWATPEIRVKEMNTVNSNHTLWCKTRGYFHTCRLMNHDAAISQNNQALDYWLVGQSHTQWYMLPPHSTWCNIKLQHTPNPLD